MSQETRNLLKFRTDYELKVFERDRQYFADLHQSKAAEAQRDADAARKELRRRKRNEAGSTGR